MGPYLGTLRGQKAPPILGKMGAPILATSLFSTLRSAMMLLLVHNDHFLAASELGEHASRPPPLADSMRNIGVLDPAGVSTMLVAQGLEPASPFHTHPGSLVRCARFLDIDSR